ncbi:MAG TPA: prenyltransferase/squalene oxidase repeat-containing protein, partial [Planctomycetota bacterium]|nr:prenyltransferase/squalene oxidase repeat-containing protein [Planctomycetota bacterium]
MKALLLPLTLALAVLPLAAQTDPKGQEIPLVRDPAAVPDKMSEPEARLCLDRALAFLVQTQGTDGHWGYGATEGLLDSGYAVTSWKDWQIGAHGIALLALMESPETPERRAALEKGMQWLLASDDPKRGNDWDNDTVWAALYTYIALTRAANDPRFQAAEWRPRIDARAAKALAFFEAQQVPLGGWGYYDFPYPTEKPKWATSFATACVVPALTEGIRLGWKVDRPMLDRAREYVRSCALPNGAYEYDLNPVPRISGGEMINNVKGSLGRIQVCNWALASSGEKSVTPDKLREGLSAFFEEHKFLDVARMRPIPHEAYYANAGYFYFFGHYYCAQVINLLPKAER